MSRKIIKIEKEIKDKIVEICNKFNNNPGELINVLHQTQDFLGYLPAEAQEVIAGQLGIPTAKVYGVVSFYSFFKHHHFICIIQNHLQCFFLSLNQPWSIDFKHSHHS